MYDYVLFLCNLFVIRHLVVLPAILLDIVNDGPGIVSETDFLFLGGMFILY